MESSSNSNSTTLTPNARLLNVGQAAEYLGVSAASLRKWSNDGLVATYRTPGGQRRYARDDLDRFIDSMRETGAAGARRCRGSAAAAASRCCTTESHPEPKLSSSRRP